MAKTFMQLCHDLGRLSNENHIDAPEMTLTFANDAQRRAFEGVLRKEFAATAMFPYAEARFDSCHGIKFWLSSKQK